MSKSKTVKTIPVLKENLGLTKTEVDAYLPVVIGGNMTAGGVALLSEKKLATVEKALERLVTKGLVKRIDGIVPVYRALPPLLSKTKELSAMLERMESLKATSIEEMDSNLKETDKVMAKLRKVARDRDAVAIQVLEDFETATLSIVKSQVELVIGITNDILTGFSNDLELTLNKGDTSLDDSIGTQFKALQMELDLSQKQLAKESKKIAREFDA
ncbi:MAG: helix-turn-helix domain-containing protein, partial [Candidatus Thorarchaeota archaeon]